MSWFLPALLLGIPLAGAVVIMIAPARQAKWIALVATTVTFVLSVILAVAFEHWHDGGFGLAGVIPGLGIESIGIRFSFGVDSVSLLLVLLTTLLMPLCVWGSFSAITERVKEYYGWLLVIEAAMIGVFVARDLIFFYICFEVTLIPMYFLIAIWGSSDRARACTKFFIYTFTGSLIALAGLLYVAWQYAEINATFDPQGVAQLSWTFDIAELSSFAAARLNPTEQGWVLLALLAGFAVKVPLFPVHTWLPLAHTEAPAAGSVILAGVLLKLGTYGLYRFVLPMVPDAVVEYAPVIAVISIIGIIYAALICWVQSDLKRLVAFSSISHLGFCVLGLMALNPLGAQGAVLYMINHGLSTGALFFLIGMIYERYHTRDMARIGGLAARMPVWAFFMVFFTLASVGLPGLNGFVSEFLCLIGTFTATADVATAAYPGRLGPWYAVAAGAGMILAAMYLLMMVGKVVFGPLREPSVQDAAHGTRLPADLSWREIGVLLPLAVLCVYLGFQPSPIIGAAEGSIENTLAAYPARVRQYVADAGDSVTRSAPVFSVVTEPRHD
ncbi:MAG: NADH-quinone oxidoreductase subunit M [Planctomycetota bacterium]|nr:MAG: NADH-quinone oxidoreductase subunit M [Planctomycetota bacterium]